MQIFENKISGVPLSQFPLLQIGKRPEEYFHISHLLPLPSDSLFGNLYLKYMNVLQRLDHTNHTIIRVFSNYAEIKENAMSPHISIHLFLQEEVVYWLRRSADELISLCSVLEKWQRTGSCPSTVPIDCIGKLLDKPHAVHCTKSRDFLKILNEVSNAHKHSFINAQITNIGADEPMVFALGLDYNKLKNKPSYYAVTLSSLINGFNLFFSEIESELKGCMIPHLGSSLWSAGGKKS